MKIDLIRASRNGDLGAWELLLQEIYPQALSHASYLLRDKDLAQDAVQNAMLKVFNNLSGLKHDGAFTGWWRRILTNEIYLLLRLNKKEISGIERELLTQNGSAAEDCVALKLELSQAIKWLPLEQQQIFLDIDLRGLDLKEVAEEYNIPLGTVKSRLFRARTRLQEALKHYIYTPKERDDMIIDGFNLNDRIYDFLEGRMDAAERSTFECELEKNTEWKQQLNRQKSFLTLLHSITGKISLKANEVKEKVQSVIDKIEDYEEIVDQISFDNGNPITMTSHVWFKKPDLYRTEGNSPLTGSMTIVVRDNFMLSWVAATKKAQKIKLSKEYMELRTNLNFPERLKAMAENKSSRILGTEYLRGRPTMHVQFVEKVPQLGEMNTHLWMDKDTWMPILIEYYNVNGQLVTRREARELRINQGLSDTLFELNLPEGVTIEEESGQELNIPKEISLENASQILGYAPYVVDNQNYKVKHQWVGMKDSKGALLSNYTVLGEQFPLLVITQAALPHANIPPNVTREAVDLEFAGTKVEGELIKFNIGGVKYMLMWQYNDLCLTCGGQLEKNELLKIPGKLVQTSNLE